MADLSLKWLDDGLMKAVKLAAFTAGKSLRDFVIQVLEEAVNGEDGSVGRDRDAAVQVADNEAGGLPKAGRKEGVRGVRRKLDNGRQVAESIAESPIARKVFKLDQPGRVVLDHDVAGCKVYRCGMCSSLGVKDSQRGLK